MQPYRACHHSEIGPLEVVGNQMIIPCHRVIGSDGKLVGFGGGVWRKEWLLDHEKQFYC